MRASLILAAGLVALSAGVAAAGVRVSFINPDQYHDQDFRAAGPREATLNEFRRTFARLGQQYLSPQQTLIIEVLEIDLAGRQEPFRIMGQDIRVMRDVTPPRIRLRYTLRERGRTLVSAVETISDTNYLANPAGRSGGQLVYEKEMLADWFKRKFSSQ